MTRRMRMFLSASAPLLLADCATKRWAATELSPHVPERVLGDVIRFTLSFNRDAAMGLSLGAWSRWGFSLLAAGAVGAIIHQLRRSPYLNRGHVVALAMIAAGAAGNLSDRLMSNRGVVDFIDVGLGNSRFWIFNVADMCVTIGAALLLLGARRVHSR